MSRAAPIVRDPGLAKAGWLKIDWVRKRMPVLNAVRDELKAGGTLRGRRVGLALHVEAKTAYLTLCLKDAGAEVAIAGCNPLSTQDDVAAALADAGIRVYGWRGATEEEYYEFIERVAESKPELIIDDGGDLVTLLHTKRRDLLPGILGGTEETTTGIHRLRAMEREGALEFPVVAVNNARCKFLFDNRYGTGQSTWDAIMRTTNLVVAGKLVVVIGYGWCGKGVAMRARGMGARVAVCEVDPVAANEALMDGFDVLPALEAAALGDIFITVTGCVKVITRRHMERMKDGALLCNAGHFDVEIWKPDLEALAVARREVRANVEEFALADGRRLYLLAEGRLVNLAAGDGHPAEIMDMSFSLQAMALDYIARHGRALGARVVELPPEVDERVAALRLKALGIEIDSLTPEQAQYLRSWHV